MQCNKKKVRPSKRNFFTIIQLGFAVVLLAIKSFNQVSYIFPLILVLLVPLRLFLMPKLFTNKELEQVFIFKLKLSKGKFINVSSWIGFLLTILIVTPSLII